MPHRSRSTEFELETIFVFRRSTRRVPDVPVIRMENASSNGNFAKKNDRERCHLPRQAITSDTGHISNDKKKKHGFLVSGILRMPQNCVGFLLDLIV